jgi:hypothetical protein
MRHSMAFGYLLLALSLCPIYAGAQPPSKLAEGAYGVSESLTQKTAGSHWEMRKSLDGGFIVEVTQSGERNQGRIVESFGFTNTWKPFLYSIGIHSIDAAQPSMSLECRFLADAISCDSLHKGKRSKGLLRIAGPKVFLPPGFMTDMFWMMATVCAQAERTPGKITNVAEVSVADDPEDSVLKLEVAESLPVAYAGQEDLKTELGTTRAHKFRIKDMTVWTADSGLLLALTPEGSDGGRRIGLSSLNDITHRLLSTPIQK